MINMWVLLTIIAIGSVLLSQFLTNQGYINSVEPMTGTGGYSDGDLVRNSTTGQIGLVENGMLRSVSYDIYSKINQCNRLGLQAIPQYLWNRFPMGNPIITVQPLQ